MRYSRPDTVSEACCFETNPPERSLDTQTWRIDGP